MDHSGQLMEENIQLITSMHHLWLHWLKWKWLAVCYQILPLLLLHARREVLQAWIQLMDNNLLHFQSSKLLHWIGLEESSCSTLTVRIRQDLKSCHQSANN